MLGHLRENIVVSEENPVDPQRTTQYPCLEVHKGVLWLGHSEHRQLVVPTAYQEPVIRHPWDRPGY